MNKCVLCRSGEDDETRFGLFYKLPRSNSRAHQNCLYLSSNLVQHGEGDEDEGVGIERFLIFDIMAESRRTQRLVCSYCKGQGANIGCCYKQCQKTFHTGCGMANGALNQFVGTYKSFCHRHVLDYEHRPSANENCAICFDRLMGPREIFNLITMIHAPCCRNGWFHKECIQKFAISAGYFFKCPLCNNIDDFHSITLRGIFIPNKDAAWEINPEAYSGQSQRDMVCVAIVCRNPKGRNSDEALLIYCQSCGSNPVHINCTMMYADVYNCSTCFVVAQNTSYDSEEDPLDYFARSTNPPTISTSTSLETDDNDNDADSTSTEDLDPLDPAYESRIGQRPRLRRSARIAASTSAASTTNSGPASAAPIPGRPNRRRRLLRSQTSSTAMNAVFEVGLPRVRIARLLDEDETPLPVVYSRRNPARMVIDPAPLVLTDTPIALRRGSVTVVERDPVQTSRSRRSTVTDRPRRRRRHSEALPGSTATSQPPRQTRRLTCTPALIASMSASIYTNRSSLDALSTSSSSSGLSTASSTASSYTSSASSTDSSSTSSSSLTTSSSSSSSTSSTSSRSSSGQRRRSIRTRFAFQSRPSNPIANSERLTRRRRTVAAANESLSLPLRRGRSSGGFARPQARPAATSGPTRRSSRLNPDPPPGSSDSNHDISCVANRTRCRLSRHLNSRQT